MLTEVIVTDEFVAWYDNLSEAEQDRVAFTVGLLEERGVTLPHPYASAIKGATFALRELRTQRPSDPHRREDLERIPGGEETGQEKPRKK
jgi:hypothetical protein